MRTGPTIKDIAREVGVTPATVSYVLSQNPRQTISPQTRQRVLEAARELGYVPNGAAKVLRNAPSYCVGVAIEKELMFSRFGLVLQGIRDRLESEGYNLMLCSFRQRRGLYPDYINNVLERRIDGVIFMGEDNTGPTPEAEALIARHQLPFVLYDCGYPDRPYSTVDLAYEQAGFDMAAQMLAQGARHLFYVRPRVDNYQEQRREAGIRRALARIPGRRLTVIRTEMGSDIHFTAVERLGRGVIAGLDDTIKTHLGRELLPALVEGGPGDGIIVSWGAFAEPVCRLLDERGWNFQVGALSDMMVPGPLRGRVTVCRLPGYEAGDACAQLLLARLAGDAKPQAQVLAMPLAEPATLY